MTGKAAHDGFPARQAEQPGCLGGAKSNSAVATDEQKSMVQVVEVGRNKSACRGCCGLFDRHRRPARIPCFEARNRIEHAGQAFTERPRRSKIHISVSSHAPLKKRYLLHPTHVYRIGLSSVHAGSERGQRHATKRIYLRCCMCILQIWNLTINLLRVGGCLI